MKKWKVAVIGVGGISEMHIRSYRSNPNVELYAFCDINEARLRKMGEKYGVSRLFTDKDELLRALPEESARAEGAVGRRAAGYRLKNMRSRWGSCNTQTGVVALNLQLARLPAFCLHYVLVHELAHLILPGHGPEFWKLMDGFCPDWRAARELMRHFPLF